jgi:iron only hydrogenase large subunit-like protein
VCPVKNCIDGSGSKVKIIADRCIGCGRCIPACLQGALSYIDDTEKFFASLSEGKNIVAIVAPAAQAVFSDILRLNGYLKSMGVKAIFDVSFGAELTVKSYLNYAAAAKPKTIISQPCPAIVSYCEIYKPELLPLLAPAHSPMLHTAVMINEYFKQKILGKNSKSKLEIAAISPCAAKKREFEETGLVQYNVSMLSLLKKMELDKIKLENFPRIDYDGPPAERAVLFSTPGGLLATLAREAPNVNSVRKIEGTDIIYKYLNEVPQMVKEGSAPFLIDCLNCEAGCNGGPATGNSGEPIDRMEAKISKRSNDAIIKNKKSLFGIRLKHNLKKYWKPDIYNRTYKNLSELASKIIQPSQSEIAEIFASMNKHTQADEFNCSACGYGTCIGMAIAIYNHLNKRENCHHYVQDVAEKETIKREEAIKEAESLLAQIEHSKVTLSTLYDKVSQYITITGKEDEALVNSNTKMSELIDKISSVTNLAGSRHKVIDQLSSITLSAKNNMQALLNAFTELEETSEKIAGIATVIEDMSSSTNLLGMNAAIEAAHAGESGRGFAVVATEIRSLSNNTRENANIISENVSKIVRQINESLNLSEKTNEVMEQVSTGVTEASLSFSEIIEAQKEVYNQTTAITDDLAGLNEISSELRKSSQIITGSLEDVQRLIEKL